MDQKRHFTVGTLFSRISSALTRWDQRQGDRAITRLIERSGGKMTDSLEFEIGKIRWPNQI